ncbi:hypothetical protein GCM10023333_15020 [Ferrimonas pelagia]|uniref:Uncharacterized protein n=1 Tax=Ferrimonas pelagia TaxID=1177826 RepID=A0ABP9ENI8_9GAMM
MPSNANADEALSGEFRQSHSRMTNDDERTWRVILHDSLSIPPSHINIFPRDIINSSKKAGEMAPILKQQKSKKLFYQSKLIGKS